MNLNLLHKQHTFLFHCLQIYKFKNLVFIFSIIFINVSLTSSIGLYLSAVSVVLYGERLGLLLDYIDPDAQHFIDCITLMFKTTSPMLYLPPALLRRLGSKIWKDHMDAWDGIFNQGKQRQFWNHSAMVPHHIV